MARRILDAFSDSTAAPSTPITASAGPAARTAVQATYAKPVVQTYSAATGYTAPAPYSQIYGPVATNPVGGYGGGGGAGIAAAPVEPPKPKIDYNSEEYLNGSKDGELDSTFHNQKSLYSEKLKKYIADYDAQTGGAAWGKNLKDFDLSQLGGSMGVDFGNAKQGIARNKDMGLRGLNEDFAQRGMTNSGLWIKDHDQSRQSYERQDTNLGQGVRNQLQTLNFNRGNVEADNTAQVAAARRDALNRLSQSQSLL
jgi:hypothetical protein